MLISEICHTEVTTILQDQTIGEAVAGIMSSEHNGYIVINTQKKVVGVLSLQDIAAATIPQEFRDNPSLPLAMYKKGFFQEQCLLVKDKRVKEIMRTNYIQVTMTTNILAVTADFLENDLYIVPVLEEGNLVGIITRTEIKRALAKGMGLIS
jgi:predicted transcriptional regulator